MTDPVKPVLLDGLEPSVDSAPMPNDQTPQPGEAAVTHSENSSEQTLQPTDSPAAPVDCTLPPTGSADTTSEVGSDQTMKPAKAPLTVGQEAVAQIDPARRFGDYEILQEIARGGMGVVYRARQISLNRTVALKKILSGQLAGEEDLKRFQVEAEASAQLDHVGIVPVYDFGQVDGQYYFSMGFVEGDDLAERIRERPLEAEAAAQMMIKIAQAVGYANAQGVIHRDLKPSNVLLDAQSEPKVTDFGVAKQQGNDSEMTAQGQILGTPSYMPPEQAAGQGDGVDQRSDVYALGAILYALLTGRPPFQAATAMETMIQVLDQDPVPISQLNGTIPRDLETICLKCLQKDPAKRYESAEALAEDLQRYLDDEPIVARPPTKTEQLGRWVRKNRAAAIGTGLVAATLIVATLVSISFAVDAGRQRDVAADQRDLAAEQRDAAELAKEEADVQRDAAQLARKEADEQREIAETQTVKAEKKADEMQIMLDFQTRQLSGIDVPAMGASLAGKMQKELDLSDSDMAEADFTGSALRLIHEHILEPARLSVKKQFADQPVIEAHLLQAIALTLSKLGLLKESLEPQARVIELRDSELGRKHPETIESLEWQASLFLELDRTDEAAELLDEIITHKRETLGNDHRDTLRSRAIYTQVLWRQHKLDESLASTAELLESQRRVLGNEDVQTLATMNGRAVLLKYKGNYDEAEKIYNEALEIGRRTLPKDNSTLIQLISNLGTLYSYTRRYEEAEPLRREVLEISRSSFGDDHPETLHAQSGLGLLLVLQEKYAEAEPVLREVIEGTQRTYGEDHPETYGEIRALAYMFLCEGKLDQAEKNYTKALEGQRRLLGDHHSFTQGTANDLAAVYMRQGKHVKAESLFREAAEGSRKSLGPEHAETLNSVNNVANALLQQFKLDEAEVLFRDVLEIRLRTLGEEHPSTKKSKANLEVLLETRREVQEKKQQSQKEGKSGGQ